MSEVNIPFITRLGVTLDSTKYSCGTYIDGDMIRFDNLGVRKIAGWELIYSNDEHIIRGLYISPYQTYVRIFLFKNTSILQIDYIPKTNTILAVSDRTPAGWVAPATNDPDLTFSVDVLTLYSETGEEIPAQLVFTGLQNGNDLGTQIESVVYIGEIDSNFPFVELVDSLSGSPVTTSGGVIVFDYYLCVYGNTGTFKWCEYNNPDQWPVENSVVVSSTKLVLAKLNLNTILVWSLSSLKELSFVPSNGTTPATFVAITRCPRITILSAQSVVEGDNNLFYWIGSNTFYVYSGQLNYLQNDFNKNYFFKNVNRDVAPKIFGMYVENFNEIWWSFPLGNSIENNAINIYNIELKTWNINSIARSCGYVSSLISYPVLASSVPTLVSTSQYGLYLHEKNWDIVEGLNTFPLHAYAVTHLQSLFDSNPSANFMMKVMRIELDADSEGDLSIQLMNYPYPQAQPILSDIYTFNKDTAPMVPTEFKARYLSMKISSNTLGGYFQTGKHRIQIMQTTEKRPSVTQ